MPLSQCEPPKTRRCGWRGVEVPGWDDDCYDDIGDRWLRSSADWVMMIALNTVLNDRMILCRCGDRCPMMLWRL